MVSLAEKLDQQRLRDDSRQELAEQLRTDSRTAQPQDEVIKVRKIRKNGYQSMLIPAHCSMSDCMSLY